MSSEIGADVVSHVVGLSSNVVIFSHLRTRKVLKINKTPVR
jgi:hypothetical protein